MTSKMQTTTSSYHHCAASWRRPWRRPSCCCSWKIDVVRTNLTVWLTHQTALYGWSTKDNSHQCGRGPLWNSSVVVLTTAKSSAVRYATESTPPSHSAHTFRATCWPRRRRGGVLPSLPRRSRGSERALIRVMTLAGRGDAVAGALI